MAAEDALFYLYSADGNGFDLFRYDIAERAPKPVVESVQAFVVPTLSHAPQVVPSAENRISLAPEPPSVAVIPTLTDGLVAQVASASIDTLTVGARVSRPMSSLTEADTLPAESRYWT